MRYVLLVAVSVLPVTVCCAANPARTVKQGTVLYNKGEFDGALKQYEQALGDSPDSAIVNFDAAAALYKLQRYPEAVRHLEKALLSDDPVFQQKAHYNLGASIYQYAHSIEDTDIGGAVRSAEESLRHFERALELDANDEDARHNLEFVKKEIERLKQKQKQCPAQTQQSKQEKNEGAGQQESTDGNPGGDPNNSPASEEQRKQEGTGPQADNEQGSRQEQADESGAESGQAQADRKEEQRALSETAAEMLLERYRDEEEPRRLYRPRTDRGTVSEPERDW